MRIAPLTLLASCVGLAGCATLLDTQGTRDLLVADAKHRFDELCSKSTEGCEFTITPTRNGGWTVYADLILRGEDGNRVSRIGADEYYFYNRHGHFVGSEAGY